MSVRPRNRPGDASASDSTLRDLYCSLERLGREREREGGGLRGRDLQDYWDFKNSNLFDTNAMYVYKERENGDEEAGMGVRQLGR